MILNRYIKISTDNIVYKLKFDGKDPNTGPSQGLKIRGGHVVLGGDNVLPLVEIGLTDLSKSGRALAPPGPSACDRPGNERNISHLLVNENKM